MKTTPRRFWMLGGAAVYAALAASGIAVTGKTQEMRNLFATLTANQSRQDRLLQEHSRLLLERGALVSYQNVDRVAEEVLAMRFPEQVERIAR